jgi:protein SCO1/2
MNVAIGLLQRVRRFIEGGGFPTFALCLLAFYEVLLLALLLMPPGPSGLGAFAEEFRIWCFGYDPATGGTQWAYVIAMATPQLFVAGFIAIFWWQPLREVFLRPRLLAGYAGAAAAVVLLAGAGLAGAWSTPAGGELPFPAEALRTTRPAPQFALTNQRGDRVELATLRGKVVMLTATYASCGHTCPLLVAQSKRAVGELTDTEREDLRVVAVTLDPENDSIEVLERLGRMQELPAPLYNLVTGEVAEVERVLDDMEVARERNPETGVIDHANLILLIDREGRVAYRLGLGPRQERWLVSALRVLLEEPAAAG